MTAAVAPRDARAGAGRLLLGGYLVASVLNVVGQLADAGWLTTVTKPVLMPLLAAWVVAVGSRTRLLRLVLVGIGLSWLGDLALMGDGDGWFLAGLGGFALAQVVYVVAFLPLARAGVLRERPAVLAPYALAWVGLVVLLQPRIEEMFLPVAVYGLLLVGMAALAVGVHRWVAVGAVLFVISDAAIALDSLAGLELPASGAIVMGTYTAAQGLIATGCVRREREPADAPPRRRADAR